MAEFIEILSPSALKDLQTANVEVLKLVSSIDSYGKKLDSIKTPSGISNAQKEIVENYKKQEQAITSLQAKTMRALEQETKARQSLDAQRQKALLAIEKENAKLNTANNLYNKVQTKLNALQFEYKALATQKELSGRLTEQEAKRYEFLQGKITKYDATLKAVDATMGKYQRNVGNYASGFSPLNNSINQLTREMPAFANSAQTGFMAISNNLPIFFDAISTTNKQLKEMRAQGEKVPSLFQSIASSFFTWGTALSIGVTLLTVFGAQIWETISGSKARKEALEKETKALEEKSRAEDQAREAFARFSSDEISKSKILLENAKNLSLSYKERVKAVNELQQRYPDYLGSLSKEQILAGDTADAENKLNDALIKRGIALASQQAIQDEINNSLKNQKWLNDKLLDIQKKREDLGKQISQIDPFTKNDNLLKKYEDLSLQLTRLFYLEGTLKEQYKDKNNTIQDSIKYYLEQYNANAKYIGVVNEETKSKEKKAKVEKELLEYQTNSEEAFKKNISVLEKQLAITDRFSPAYELINGLLTIQKTLYEQLFGSIKKVTEAKENYIEISEEELYPEYFAWLRLKEATDEYLKTISSNEFNKAFDNIGLASAKMFLDFDENGETTFQRLLDGATSFQERFAITFQAIGDVAQDVFNKISELSQRRFDEEYRRLEEETKVRLLFAGDSEAGRVEIERQSEEKRREIAKREAKAKQKQALFNIAIDTAQAVARAVALSPLTFGMPFTAFAIAIGALQASLVSSQQIPEFYKGTDNAPMGWAKTDERGAEIHTDSKGNIKDFGSNKGARLKFLEKGDKIFTAEKSRELMFNSDLNNLLMRNNINSPIVVNNSGLNNSDFNKGISRLAETISNKSEFELVRDRRGERIYKRENGQRIELIGNQLRFKGQNV